MLLRPLKSFTLRGSRTAGIRYSTLPALDPDVGESLAPSESQLMDASINPRSLRPSMNHMLHHDDYFKVHELYSLVDLIKYRAHFGHKLGTVNPRMIPYLYGHRMGVCMFDLHKTMQHLQLALNFTAHIAAKGGVVLFLSCQSAVIDLVERTALDCGEYGYTRKWRDGVFVDSKNQFGCTVRLPDVVIMVNTLSNAFQQHPAVIECAKLAIPTIGLVDSNCDPSLVTYPVPCNDDSYTTVSYMLRAFKQAIVRGKSDHNTRIGAPQFERPQTTSDVSEISKRDVTKNMQPRLHIHEEASDKMEGTIDLLNMLQDKYNNKSAPMVEPSRGRDKELTDSEIDDIFKLIKK